MGKPRDGKVPILPYTTRRGTTLNTSVALDSPSVMSKLLTPPHAHATTSAEFENATDNFDDASTVLDESGSLGYFLDATIARAKQIGNATVTPASSPESREHPSDDFDDAYIELDDAFIDECQATSDAGAIGDLLARRAVRYKLSLDAKFAASSINISDKDYALLGKPLSVEHHFGLQWRTPGAPCISSHWYLLPVAHGFMRHSYVPYPWCT
jgi:hypothetical protein